MLKDSVLPENRHQSPEKTGILLQGAGHFGAAFVSNVLVASWSFKRPLEDYHHKHNNKEELSLGININKWSNIWTR